MSHILKNSFLELKDFANIVHNNVYLEISEELYTELKKSHDFLSDFSKDKIIYGINTGLGPMAQYKIQPEEQIQLQFNLIRSHAVGAGKTLDDASLKAAMLARLNSFFTSEIGS